jgi:hypothetical protein
MDETTTTIHLAQLTGVVGSSILSGNYTSDSLPPTTISPTNRIPSQV